MGLSVDAMRDTVRTAYPGDKWKAKVDKMSDNQVMAIYFRMCREPSKAGKHSRTATRVHTDQRALEGAIDCGRGINRCQQKIP